MQQHGDTRVQRVRDQAEIAMKTILTALVALSVFASWLRCSTKATIKHLLDRRDAHSLALGAGGEFRHAAVSVVVRPCGAGLAVRGADATVVLHASREHQAPASGHRGADRTEGVGVITNGSRARRPALRVARFSAKTADYFRQSSLPDSL